MGVVSGRQQKSRTQQFELQTGGCSTLEFGEPGIDQVSGARELRKAEPLGLGAHCRDLAVRCIDQATIDGIGHLVENYEVAQSFEEVGGKPPWVKARVDDAVDDGEHRGPVSCRKCVDDLVQALSIDPQTYSLLRN